MKALTIIKAGSTFPTTKQRLGDFEDWVIRASDLSPKTISVINLMEGEALPPVERLSAGGISGRRADRLPG